MSDEGRAERVWLQSLSEWGVDVKKGLGVILGILLLASFSLGCISDSTEGEECEDDVVVDSLNASWKERPPWGWYVDISCRVRNLLDQDVPLSLKAWIIYWTEGATEGIEMSWTYDMDLKPRGETGSTKPYQARFDLDVDPNEFRKLQYGFDHYWYGRTTSVNRTIFPYIG